MSQLSPGLLFAYTLPMLGSGAMDLFFDAFSFKFCTDTLLVSPAIMGSIFSAGRVWDAVSDPLAGYLSDRTVSRFGRRRLWVLASAVPLGLSFAAVFAPPTALATSASLIGWQTGAILCYYTSVTAFKVPHTCLGVEMSLACSIHERSRVFTYRSFVAYVGAIVATVLSAVAFGKADVAGRRSMVALCTLSTGLFSLLTQAASVPWLREPDAVNADSDATANTAAAAAADVDSSAQRVAGDAWRLCTLPLDIFSLLTRGCLTRSERAAVDADSNATANTAAITPADKARRASPSVLRVAGDVWRNPHARILTIVLFIEDGSRSAFALLGPYTIQYIALLPALWTSIVILVYLLATMASLPIWHILGCKYGKLRMWRGAMLMTAGGFTMALAIIHPRVTSSSLHARAAYLFCVATTIGAGTGAGAVLGMAIKGDVVDYDQSVTGERQAGAYFALWSFCTKSAGGALALLTGVMLEMAGFVPNVAQSDGVRWTIAVLFGLLPTIGIMVGWRLIGSLTLDETAHAKVRMQLLGGALQSKKASSEVDVLM